MKQKAENRIVAQEAADWNEKETHEQIMKSLDTVRGYVSSYVYINGNCYYWATTPLPEEQALAIARRGNHEEILYMIHQYGKAHRVDANRPLDHVWPCVLPDSVQIIIANRNNREEMDAFLSYNGFGKAGQDIILDRGDHCEIMRCLDRHGFLPEQQRRLKARGNQDEIDLHIKRHGWCHDLLDEMFERYEKTHDSKEFRDFVSKHELPVSFQRRMLKTVTKEDFLFYVERYGLWEEVHPDLVRERSVEEILFYIKKHRYLSVQGERELADRHLFAVNMTYVQYRYYKKSFNFVECLIGTDPIDYAAVTALFLEMEPEDFGYYQEEEVKRVKNGSHEEVMEYVTENRLSRKALAELFFRNNPKELEAYADKWLRKS